MKVEKLNSLEKAVKETTVTTVAKKKYLTLLKNRPEL
jgi:hypothetical protein